MDKETKDIIKRIASIQMDALSNIIENPEDKDHDLLITLLQVKSDEIVSSAEQVYNFYKEVENMPELIKMANEYQVLVCHHILFQMEDEWILDNSEGVFGAWAFLHEALSKFHPEFRLML
jgi:hypothetical protein